ncbi:MAG: hypothetical protein KC505_03345 [Myxococcales bacterium]|nr:hypothetical protein [Myxococcales bacterium]USN49784.1 MAG: hypothetical protein H6731_05745 [Myxococcales bacterium]
MAHLLPSRFLVFSNAFARFSLNLACTTSDATQKTWAFRLFRTFLIIKISLPYFFPYGLSRSFDPVAWIIFTGIVALSFSKKFYIFSLTTALAISFNELLNTWPFSINHGFLEFFILILSLLIPENEDISSQLSCTDLIKILMLSVWFYSGVHKLFDGYYWNAEFFALEALSDNTTLGNYLNSILNIFGQSDSFAGQIPFGCCSQAVIHFGLWQRGLLLACSWFTIIAELGLPILVLVPKFRNLGITGLFIFQVTIAFFSGEIDFAFSALAILLLFVPKSAPYGYVLLTCLIFMVQPWL